MLIYFIHYFLECISKVKFSDKNWRSDKMIYWKKQNVLRYKENKIRMIFLGIKNVIKCNSFILGGIGRPGVSRIFLKCLTRMLDIDTWDT